jgi:hypothetical protein
VTIVTLFGEPESLVLMRWLRDEVRLARDI